MLDILAFGAHPDDIELGCGGTIIKELKAGRSVAVVDLTRERTWNKRFCKFEIRKAQVPHK